MGSSSSINTVALYNSQPQLHFLKHGHGSGSLYNIHKPQLSLLHPPIITLKPLITPLLLHCTTPKPSNFFQISPLSHLPTSSLLANTTLTTTSSISPQPHKKSQIFFLQKIKMGLLLVVVGSLVLMECLCRKPVLALPAQKTSVSENLENTQNQKSEQEEEMYVKMLEKTPRDVDALKVLVYGFMRRGKTREAVKYVDRLIDVEPEEVEWRLLQAICYEMMGQLTKAKRLFIDILEERPLLLRALHGLAMVMHKNHEGAAVFEMLNKALEVACREKRVTEERNIKILIAQMHVVKGQLDDGLKKFENLVEENPRDFRPYLCQGIVYSLLDKKKEAEEQFETYRSLVPEEFPQRGFLDDVVLTAKTKSQEGLKKDFEAEYSYRK